MQHHARQRVRRPRLPLRLRPTEKLDDDACENDAALILTMILIQDGERPTEDRLKIYYASWGAFNLD